MSEMDWSQQTDHGRQSQMTWECCDIHNPMQGTEELHSWKSFYKISILGREWVNSIFERIFMNSFTDILNKGKKENSTALFQVTIVEFSELPKQKQKNKNGDHLTLDTYTTGSSSLRNTVSPALSISLKDAMHSRDNGGWGTWDRFQEGNRRGEMMELCFNW